MNYNPFVRVAEELGKKQEYFQGTGGNISLKYDQKEMSIKASGVRVHEMSSHEGLVSVSHVRIRNHFYNTEVGDEEESFKVIQSAVIVPNAKRPSIETGFHAILNNAVIHSHCVYINILMCSSSCDELIDKLFSHTDIRYRIVEYATPGHALTQKIKESIAGDYSGKQVIFLKNHGVIVSALSLIDAVWLHEKVIKIVRDYFRIEEDYPKAKLTHMENGQSLSASPILQDFVKNNIEYFLQIEEYTLFPDLIVFCKDIVVSDDEFANDKIVINPRKGEIRYTTSKKEAHIIEENLVAWVYLLMMLEKHTLTPVFIPKEQTEIIENLESEKYRKELLK